MSTLGLGVIIGLIIGLFVGVVITLVAIAITVLGGDKKYRSGK